MIPLDGGGDLNEIVTDPVNGYVAAIGGGEHNYQRYPVRLRDGRTIQYVVAGSAGAPLSATHRIPNVDRLAPAVSEDGFRCYPLRGDSLARFSRTHRGLLGVGSLAIRPGASATPPRGRRRRRPRSRPGPGGQRARSTLCPQPGTCCPATRRPP